jgi:hypothetical protein
VEGEGEGIGRKMEGWRGRVRMRGMGL